MAHEFNLPDVGEGVSEGELVSWLVDVGDPVTEDQPVAEVETDKALVEIPAPVDGTVQELHYEPGDIMAVGEVFITFDVDGDVDDAPEESAPADAEEESTAPAKTADPEQVFAPPSVRRRARELDVDLATVEGTGPSGRITEEDVEAAASDEPVEPDTEETDTIEPEITQERAERDRTLATPATRRVAREADVDLNAVPATETRDGEAFVSEADVRAFADGQLEAQEADAEAATVPEPEREERIPYRGVRRTIGDQMERSKYTAPHVTHHELIEVASLVETRDELKAIAEDRGIKLTYLPFVMKALVAALREHPVLNAVLDEDAEEIVQKHYYNIGVAVATDAGLMVPVVDDVESKDMLQLASETNELAQKARDRQVSPDDLQGSTITITNFGSIGGDYATPIINYPEVAIIGLGALKERPVVEDGEVVARPTLPLSISIDHRVVDGAEVAAFADTFGQYLSNPRRLLLG